MKPIVKTEMTALLQLSTVRGAQNRAGVGARASTLVSVFSLSHSHSHFILQFKLIPSRYNLVWVDNTPEENAAIDKKYKII